jgi:hypothetical protein
MSDQVLGVMCLLRNDFTKQLYTPLLILLSMDNFKYSKSWPKVTYCGFESKFSPNGIENIGFTCYVNKMKWSPRVFRNKYGNA